MQNVQTSTSKGPSALSLGGGVEPCSSLGLTTGSNTSDLLQCAHDMADFVEHSHEIGVRRHLGLSVDAESYLQGSLEMHLHLRVWWRRTKQSKPQTANFCALFDGRAARSNFRLENLKAVSGLDPNRRFRSSNAGGGNMDYTMLIGIGSNQQLHQQGILLGRSREVVRLQLLDSCQ